MAKSLVSCFFLTHGVDNVALNKHREILYIGQTLFSSKDIDQAHIRVR